MSLRQDESATFRIYYRAQNLKLLGTFKDEVTVGVRRALRVSIFFLFL